MAHPKRAIPLSPDEKRARDREYQHTRRHRTNNAYARAYRRAMQRAVEWVQEHQPGLWEQLKTELTPYRPQETCRHDAGRYIVGVVTACEACGKVLGAEKLTLEQRIRVTSKLLDS